MYNKTIVIGRLFKDPAPRETNTELKAASFTVWNSTMKDGKEDRQFNRVVAYGKQAELVMQHLHEGDLCCIEGAITNRKGALPYIMAEHVTFISSKRTANKENA